MSLYPWKPTPEQTQQVKAWRKSGYGWDFIADELDAPYYAVRDAFRSLGNLPQKRKFKRPYKERVKI